MKQTAIHEGFQDKPRSLWNDAWRRLRYSITARIGIVIVTIIVLAAVLAPLLDPYDPKLDADLENSRQPPSWQHIMGTDRLGRDIFRRIVHGARLSLSVGLVAVVVSGSIGTVLGLVTGYFGGAVDMVIMRLMDILMAFPGMLLAIAIVAVRGTGLFNTMVALSVTGVAGYARLVRSMVLSLREREYVLAAHMVGVRDPRIIFRHILPNSLAPIIVKQALNKKQGKLFLSVILLHILYLYVYHIRRYFRLGYSYKELNRGRYRKDKVVNRSLGHHLCDANRLITQK